MLETTLMFCWTCFLGRTLLRNFRRKISLMRSCSRCAACMSSFVCFRLLVFCFACGNPLPSRETRFNAVKLCCRTSRWCMKKGVRGAGPVVVQELPGTSRSSYLMTLWRMTRILLTFRYVVHTGAVVRGADTALVVGNTAIHARGSKCGVLDRAAFVQRAEAAARQLVTRWRCLLFSTAITLVHCLPLQSTGAQSKS